MRQRCLAQINKRVTNPAMERVASRVVPWAVVVHEGRRSGRTYKTPVVAVVHGGFVTIALPYGRDADWVKNLLAAGSGSVMRRGRRYQVVDPQVDPQPGGTAYPAAWAARRLGIHVLTATMHEPA